MNNKVVWFPRRTADRKRRDSNHGILRYEVSGRWFQFPDASYKFEDMEYLHLDIMTLGTNEQTRELCELIVDKQQLLKMLSDLPANDRTKT